MSLSDLLTSLATIQRQTVSATSSGGASRTWTTRASNVPCHISSLSAHSQAEFQRLDIVVDAAIYFDTDQSLLKEDRVNVGVNRYFVKSYNGAIDPARDVMIFKALVQTRNQTVNP